MDDVEYRSLGRSGLEVSAISFGGWLTLGGQVDDDTGLALLARAVERGINFIDLADVYAGGRAEEVAGRFIAQHGHRHRLVLSSKVFWPQSDDPNDRGLSRKHIFESLHRSLKRLGTDYLDLYFCHREDGSTPLDETARAMDDAIRQGKVLYWGTSCWQPATLLKVHGLTRLRGWTPPTAEQPPYNLLDRHIEKRVVPVARSTGMGLVTWSPLAEGILTGKYDRDLPERSRAHIRPQIRDRLTDEVRSRIRKLGEMAAQRGLTSAQLTLAWLLGRPGISSVITGASRLEQLEENLAATEVHLDDADVKRISELFPA